MNVNDLKDSEKKFILSEICFNSIQAGVARLSSVYNSESDAVARKAWRNKVTENLERQIQITPDDGTHINRIEEFRNSIKDDILKKGKVEFGVAQKILNLFLKYCWSIGWIDKPPHCPIDSNVLKWVGRDDLRWSTMTGDTYREVIKEIVWIS